MIEEDKRLMADDLHPWFLDASFVDAGGDSPIRGALESLIEKDYWEKKL